jgi:hypothetical protein
MPRVRRCTCYDTRCDQPLLRWRRQVEPAPTRTAVRRPGPVPESLGGFRR